MSLLKRNEIGSKFYGYHSKNNITGNEETLNYLNEMKEYINSFEYQNDNNFVICGRKKFIYDEIMNILKENQNVKQPIYFVLGSLEEFISNNNSISPSQSNYAELRAKNDEYIKSGYICLEEKNYIEDIINKIEEYISKNR